mgnify:FL=1
MISSSVSHIVRLLCLRVCFELVFFDGDDECADEGDECECDWHGCTPLLGFIWD